MFWLLRIKVEEEPYEDLIGEDPEIAVIGRALRRIISSCACSDVRSPPAHKPARCLMGLPEQLLGLRRQ